MPSSSNVITEFLERAGVHIDVRGSEQFEFVIDTAVYRTAEGSNQLRVVMNILEQGQFVTIIAPRAFHLDGPHRAAAIETCLRFQWTFRLSRLEYDHRDGELRPAIHLSVLDGDLTADQVLQAVGALCATCDKLYEVLPQALQNGTMPDFADRPVDRRAELASRLAEFTDQQIDLLFTALIGESETGESRGRRDEA